MTFSSDRKVNLKRKLEWRDRRRRKKEKVGQKTKARSLKMAVGISGPGGPKCVIQRR